MSKARSQNVRRTLAFLGVALGPVAAHAQWTAAAPPQASAAVPLVLRGLTVIDVRGGRRLPDQTMILVGSRIQALGRARAVPVPRGARVVNARGRYLIPGLWDLHVHPHHYVDVAFPLFLANGVTGVRDAGSNVPLDTLTLWKREIAAGSRVGPRLIVSGPSLFGMRNVDPTLADTTRVTRGTGKAAHTLSVPLADVRRVMDSLHAAGADMLKLYAMPSAERAAMTVEARRLGMLFGGHSEETPGLVFSDSGATFLDHTTWFQPDVCGESLQANPAACRAAAARLRHNRTWVTVWAASVWPSSISAAGRAEVALHARRYRPTSFSTCPFTNYLSDADMAAVRKLASAADWTTSPGIGANATGNTTEFARWHAAGIPMVVGTDVGIDSLGFRDCLNASGFTVHQALVAFVLAGMTPLEALQTATLNPALALRATDSLGTVDAGKVADVVLLDADPLADIWNVTKIRAVVANGRYYDRAALDRLLLQAELEAARR